MRFTISAVNGDFIDRTITRIRRGLLPGDGIVWVWNSGANEDEVWADIKVGNWSYLELLEQLRNSGRIDVRQFDLIKDSDWTVESFQWLLRGTFEGA